MINQLKKRRKDGSKYIGTFKVLKIFEKSKRRQVIKRGLTRDEAMSVCKSFPSSKRHMVCFTEQFRADKYYL
jgi:hypothetical protein